MSREIHNVFHRLWKQNPYHDTQCTTNHCPNCGEVARGDDLCSGCIIQQADLSPQKKEELRLYLECIKEIRKIEANLTK